jgi:CelD/BcsL family acetyltransferase involved in cellulose biosynthesis
MNHVAEWRRLQRLDPILESPYLCPEFIQIAAQVRPGIIIAIAEEAGRPVAFLPMQVRRGIAGPVASPLSDCQAIITEHEWCGDVREMFRAARVSAYDFNHQRMQPAFESYHKAVFPSPVIDLSDGFTAYVATMREHSQHAKRSTEANHTGRPHQTLKKARWVEAHMGPIRFTFHEDNQEALATLIQWKRSQYQQGGEVLPLLDLFAFNWTGELLERIRTTQSENFAGVLSTLRIGDQLVAAHMGMRSHNVLHWWFPAYDRQFAKVSPGLILLLKLSQIAAANGVREIELGPGDESYKELVANSQIMLASGFIGSASVPLWLRYLAYGAESMAIRLPIAQRTWPGRLCRRMNRLRWLRL